MHVVEGQSRVGLVQLGRWLLTQSTAFTSFSGAGCENLKNYA